MVGFRIWLGLPPDGQDIAQHIKYRKAHSLKKDAQNLSEKSIDHITKVVKETVACLGETLKKVDTGAYEQVYLINFVADLAKDFSTKQLHYLVQNHHVNSNSIVNAFLSSLGVGDHVKVLNLIKAFPELLFIKMSDNTAVYTHFQERHWEELIEANVLKSSFFYQLQDQQIVKLFKVIPHNLSFLKDKKLIDLIAQRESVRNELLYYLDELIKAKNPKASFIMRLISMPLTSKNREGDFRIVKYCQVFSGDEKISKQLVNLDKIKDLHFLAEFLSVLHIPETLDFYPLHFTIGKLLTLNRGLKRKALECIKDPEMRKKRNMILTYCVKVYQTNKSKKANELY